MTLQFQPVGDGLNTIQTSAEQEIPGDNIPGYENLNYTVVPNYNRRDRPPRYHSNLGPTVSPPGYSSPWIGASAVHNHEQPRSGSPIPVRRFLNVDTLRQLMRFCAGRGTYSSTPLELKPFTSPFSVLIHGCNNESDSFDEQ